MDVEYRKIAEAYEFVSAGELFSRRAYLDTTTGDVRLHEEPCGFSGLPEADDSGRFVAIPTRTELQLGKPLFISFTKARLPAALSEVYKMFCSKGAHARFREFLERNGLLDQWHEFERGAKEKALRKWCREKGISLTG